MPETSTSLVLLFSLVIILAFAFIFFAFWFGWRMADRSSGVSPYTGLPLRRANDLTYFAAERVVRFMLEFQEYDNRPFKLNKAAYCRETGRIFPNCITLLDTVKVDWTFLQKRYPGSYVSWGSLSNEQQRDVKKAHSSMVGYQTDESSPTSSPRMIEPEYVHTRPGPLYVDFQTKTLLGWMVVPYTDLEVLIVRKPDR
ncbi:MAG: hypothetical protein LW832_01945 [Parachlamydia sp.]|jgi:hypothetical protein|nr:hypothetical protein [Parachlamydia sp.]